jgi:acyl-coenzyme A thioesterase PaaI-like protein
MGEGARKAEREDDGQAEYDDAVPGGDGQNGAAHTSVERVATAAAMRRLGNALVDRQVDDGLLLRIRRQIEELLPLVEAGEPRPHAFLEHGTAIFTSTVRDGKASAPRNGFPDCIVSGSANPMGVAARLWREGDEAVLTTTLGPAFEGAPGRAHGGIVAALIDETMGLVLSIISTPAFTGRLCVTYRGPTPLGQPLEVRARMAGRTQRKLTLTAELRTEDRLLAEAEALFIAVDPERFFVTGS